MYYRLDRSESAMSEGAREGGIFVITVGGNSSAYLLSNRVLAPMGGHKPQKDTHAV